MYKLLFLDTETTGNEKKDFLCQVCYSIGDEFFTKNFNPPIPISIESMAVHHITPKMVEQEERFKDSVMYKTLEGLLKEPETILVAHNAPFDIMMLEKEGLKVPRAIDTLRVIRHLDDEQKIAKHNLQYLRYFLGFELDAPAHDARGDVIVLKSLYAHLLQILKTKESITDDDKAIERMIEISNSPSLIKTFMFGKHKGTLVSDVAKSDREYLRWLLEQKKNSSQNEEDWIYTLENYLN
jgi:exodeoxyribonuclease X